MEIKSSSQRIFRTSSPKTEQNSCQTNPFGVNFKGNMITADVFDKPEKSTISFGQKAQEILTRKMTMSAVLAPMSQSISRRLNSIMSFGRRLGENTAEAWRRANKIEIPFHPMANLMQNLSDRRTYSVSNLKNLDTGELENMLTAAIA
ncbi:MAG: hypothetical protein WCG95_03355 [bacterium]